MCLFESRFYLAKFTWGKARINNREILPRSPGNEIRLPVGQLRMCYLSLSFSTSAKLLFSKSIILLLTVIITVSGCNGETAPSPASDDSGLNFELPEKLRTSLAVNPDQVSGILTVNGQTYNLERFDQRFRAIVPNVPANSNVTIALLFTETLPDGRSLDLARTEPQTILIGATDTTRTFNRQQYLYDFDDDNDGISNIVERNDATDPFTAENAGTRTVSVEYSIPQRINDPTITQIRALIADNPKAATPIGNGRFRSTSEVSILNSFDVEILLVQFIDVGLNGGSELAELRLAEASSPVEAGDQNLTIQLQDGDFSFAFDADGDGIVNIDEVQSGTDPFSGQ